MLFIFSFFKFNVYDSKVSFCVFLAGKAMLKENYPPSLADTFICERSLTPKGKPQVLIWFPYLEIDWLKITSN